jgi:hypothetical protein
MLIVAVNTVNEKSQTADRGGPSAWVLVTGLIILPHNMFCVTELLQKSWNCNNFLERVTVDTK